MEGNEYQIPSFLLNAKPKAQSSDVWEKLKQTDQLVDLLLSREFRQNADDLAIHAALGEIRLPHIIPAQLSEEVVRRVGSLSISKPMASFYTLVCSSLYYETLAGQINLRKARTYAHKIHELFKDHLGSLSANELFTTKFGNALKEYQGKRDNSPEVPNELLDILDCPLLVREEFNRFFDKTQQLRRVKATSTK